MPFTAGALGHKNLHGATDQSFVQFPRHRVLCRHQALKTLLDDLFGDLVRHGRCGSARPDRILEGVRLCEPSFSNHVERVLKVRFSLTGETHDDVRRDGSLRDSCPNPLHNSQKLIPAVAPAHGLQYGVRSRLERHVKLWHDYVGFGHSVDDIIGEGGRVGAGEAHALQALDRGARPQKLPEGKPITKLNTIRVDVLPQIGDFDCAVVHEGFRLVEDIPRTAVLFLTAEARHNAKGARVVAAHRNRHKARVTGIPL